MLPLWMLLVAVVVTPVAVYAEKKNWKPAFGGIAAILAFVSCFSVLVMWCIVPIEYLVSYGTVAEIEALRAEVDRLGVDARTDHILGKVAGVNMEIARYKCYTETTLDWFFPDNIANMSPIVIPKVEKIE